MFAAFRVASCFRYPFLPFVSIDHFFSCTFPLSILLQFPLISQAKLPRRIHSLLLRGPIAASPFSDELIETGLHSMHLFLKRFSECQRIQGVHVLAPDLPRCAFQSVVDRARCVCESYEETNESCFTPVRHGAHTCLSRTVKF